MNYNPYRDPEPDEWLALPEDERIALVLTYHERVKAPVPKPTLHATIHTIVENQVALGKQTPVAGTLTRLMRDGLDRHDAIHAIGSVLVKHFERVRADEITEQDPNRAYYRDLARLKADSWSG
jgi:UDP-N-acetylmuramyl tripeptide synthase